MSVGFFSLIFFIIALPGLLFRRFYYQGDFSKQFNTKDFIINLFYSFIIGAIIIFISIIIHNKFVSVWLKWEPVLSQDIKEIIETCLKERLILINYVDKFFDQTFLSHLLVFGLIVLINSILFSSIIFYLIRQLRLDINFKILGFNNYWYYYLRGEFLRFSDFNIDYKKIHFVYADILVKINESNYKLYTGVIKQYYLDSNGNLESIHLSEVSKYDDNAIVRQREIPSHCFIIPNSNIININLRVLYESNNNTKYYNFISRFKPVLFVFSLIFPFLILPEKIVNLLPLPVFATTLFSLYLAIFVQTLSVLSNIHENKAEKKKQKYALLGFLIIFITLYVIVSLLNYILIFIMTKF
jgi:hypothetical protein